MKVTNKLLSNNVVSSTPCQGQELKLITSVFTGNDKLLSNNVVSSTPCQGQELKLITSAFTGNDCITRCGS